MDLNVEAKESSIKRFDFKKNGHNYSFYYDDPKGLINYLVEIADGTESNLDIMDIFSLVRNLAVKDKKKAKGVEDVNDDKCDICGKKLVTDGYKWWCVEKHDTTDESK
jgi:hypothetical protein